MLKFLENKFIDCYRLVPGARHPPANPAFAEGDGYYVSDDIESEYKTNKCHIWRANMHYNITYSIIVE